MQKLLLVLCLLVTCSSSVRAQDEAASAHSETAWRPAQAENLLQWILRAEDEAITIPEGVPIDLREAIDSGDRQRLGQVADTAALHLLRAYHGKCCGVSLPGNWHISQEISDSELRARLETALANDRLDLMLRASRPDHPYYRALAAAYAREPDAARRALLALNLSRWRNLPLPETGRYLIVNAAAQQATLWEGRSQVDSWRVIVGRTVSPTPVFSTEVSGVVINPWWNIPTSIAAEGIAAFVRRNPAAARAQGYVYSDGRYRQMPGENNALGRIKLVMPNPYSVFLHDTSNRALFDRENRFLSHGCVRVDQALEFATTLLAADGWERADVEERVATGETATIALSRPIPLYIAYFTAEPDDSGHDTLLARYLWP